MPKHAQQMSNQCTEGGGAANLETALLELATQFVNLPVDETDSAIQQILELVANFTTADCCGVSKFDLTTYRLENLHAWPLSGAIAISGEGLSTVELRGTEALFGNVDEPTLVVDATTDPRFPEGFGEAFASFGIRALAWIPIWSDDRCIVAIGITSGLSTEWNTEHVALLQTAGKLIANLRFRAQTATELEETTHLFDQMSRCIEQNFFVWEPDPPRILYSNDAIESIVGIPKETWCEDASPFLEQIHPDDLEAFVDLFTQGQVVARELEYRITHTDGSTRWLRTQVFPANGSGQPGKRLAGVTEDITERVNADCEAARLRDFEQSLSTISRRFVQRPLGEMDSALTEALAAVASFAGVEHARVYLFDPKHEWLSELASWHKTAPEVESEALQTIEISAWPHLAEVLFTGGSISFSNPDELPESAVQDRAQLKRHGHRSGFGIPLQAGDGLIGALLLTTTTHRCLWPEKETSMLRMSGDIIAAALARRESERELQEAILFERLVTFLVSDFMSCPVEELDDGVGRALEAIVSFVDCKRGGIFLLDEMGEHANLIRGWWAPGSTPLDTAYASVELSSESPYGRWIRSEEPHFIIDPNWVESLRAGAGQAMREKGIGTIANIPLVTEGRRIGWLSVGAAMPRVNWTPTELHSLTVAAHALANMLARRQSEEDRRRQETFDDALSMIAADFIKRPIAETKSGIKNIVDRFGLFADCQRAAVLLLDHEAETAATYYEWIAEGDPDPVVDFPISAAPAFFEQLKNASGPWIMHRDEFPRSDENAGIALDFIGIQTLLNSPIVDGDRLLGYASVGYSRARHCPPPGTSELLTVAAGIIANALSRERLELEATKHRETLARSSRLGSIGQLATGIAHELNQPLAAIANYAHICVTRFEGGGAGAGDLSEFMRRISDESLRAGGIVQNLRRHVKGGGANRRSTPVHEIVSHAVALLAGTAREYGVDIVVDHGEELPNVYVDPIEVEQVIINLVQNAIDSIESSGAEFRMLRITTARKHSFVDVDVVDTGEGIASSETDRVFEQHHTTKPGGLGLGLSISRYLAESNGGSLKVVPTPQPGATFRFSLPIG